MDQLQHDYIQINGIRMHYVTAGTGPLLLLLHGFPEFWYSWRQQIPVLSEHFTVVAPDQRGYNETDKPAWGYELDVLVTDIVELIRKLGHERAIVLGHDWGGMVAWALAMSYPHRVERLININIPHPALFVRALRHNRAQMRRSLYAAFFQLPFLPELALSANDYAVVEWMLRGIAVNREAFSDSDIQAYKDAISKPGALTAMLNWYRAAGRTFGQRILPGDGARVDVPTLLIWGERDPALGVELTYGTEKYVPNLQLHYVPQGSHWVHHEHPDLVNRYILDFLADYIVDRKTSA